MVEIKRFEVSKEGEELDVFDTKEKAICFAEELGDGEWINSSESNPHRYRLKDDSIILIKERKITFGIVN